MTEILTPPETDRRPLPRPFLRVWGGQTISEIGSVLSATAASVYVFLETGNPVWLGALAAAAAAPAALVASLASHLDRWPRRTTMLVADAIAVVPPIVLLLIAATGRIQAGHLLVAAMITGLGTAVQMAAGQAAIVTLVEHDQLDRANGLRQLGPALGVVIGPVAALPLLVHGGIVAVLLVDLVTFVIGSTAVLVTRFGSVEVPVDDDGSMRAAFAWLRRHQPALLGLMAVTAIVNVLLAVFNVAVVAHAVEVVGPARVGLVLGAGGLAMVGGALAVGKRGVEDDRIGAFTTAISLAAAGCVLAAVRPSGLLLAIGMVVMLGFVPVATAALAVLYSERVPDAMQGRVFALRGAIGQVLHPVGSLAAGVLIARFAQPLVEGDGVLGDVGRTLVGGPRGAALCLVLVGAVLAAVAVTLRTGPVRRHLQ